MINLLARYKISCSLRGGPPLSAFWRSVVDRSPALRAFEQNTGHLDRQLADQARAEAPMLPRDLHSSILEAVRQADRLRPRRAEPRSWPIRVPRLHWALSIATVMLLGLAFWWVRSPDQGMDPGPFTGLEVPAPRTAVAPFLPTPNALFAEVQLLQTMIAVNSLDQQWEALAEDARATARFLVASLP